ncbi:MAG TPA: glycosyltransferase family 4 protein [Bryobacteraceae bacterium]|nr:glycosyltransferase family 4 protein [Bryobacteraceae bacterium]
MDVVLTTYPLSREFNEKLDGLIKQDVLKLTLAQLREASPVAMLRRLRGLKADRIYIPIEDENGFALFPVLALLASVTRCRSIIQITSDGEARVVKRAEIAKLVGRLIRASASAKRKVSRARKEVSLLLASERLPIARPAGDKGLFLNANLWFGIKAGGSVGHISGVVNGLLLEKCSVHFASAGGRMLVKPEARYTELQPSRDFGIPWENNYYDFNFKTVDQVSRIIEAESIEFIYQRMSLANYSGVSLSRKYKIPLILEYNGSEAWVARNWGKPLRNQLLAEQVEEACLKHAHLIVTISDVLRDELVDRGIDLERIVTYPNCIDPDAFNPANFSALDKIALRKSYGIEPDAVVVTFVGTFGQWHGAEILARAIHTLSDQHADWVKQSKVHFLFVGDGLKMPDVLDALGPHAKGSHVTLAGLVPQRDAPSHLAASDILVSPHVANADGSRFFGSPTKLFEYLAMGKAILASNLDQIGEVLSGSTTVSDLAHGEPKAGSVALLAAPGSADDLVFGIRYLVDHPTWRQELGNRARELALGRYTWQHHVRSILDGARRLMLLAHPAEETGSSPPRRAGRT